LADEPCEHFYAVLLDNKHRKMRDVLVSKGSLTASIVHPRDVFAQVVRHSAAAVLFVHNHPSGDCSHALLVTSDRPVLQPREFQRLQLIVVDYRHLVSFDAQAAGHNRQTRPRLPGSLAAPAFTTVAAIV